MKKQLLKSVALFGALACALTASAEKRYLQVTSESMLQDGGQYVIGVVGTNATVWQPINPLCFTLSSDNSTIEMVSKPDLDFTDKMIWTASINASLSCPNVHITSTGNDYGMHHKILQFTQNDGANALCVTNSAISVGTTSTLASNIEFIPCPTTIGDVTDDYVFLFHINPTSTRFQNIFGIRPNGTPDTFSTRSDGEGAWQDGNNLKGGEAINGIFYSGINRVYLVIDSENLSIAANALWKSFQEEETARTSDAYAAIVNALEMPSDLTGYSINTIETELKKVFQREVVAATATTAPTADKFYRIISANPDFASHNKNLKGVYLETNGGLRWKDVDFADNTFVWVFEPKGNNKYSLRPATNGKYISTVSTNQQYTTQFAPKEVTLVVNTNNKTVRIDNPLDFHCLGHNGGADDEGNIIGWENANHNPSLWYLQEIQDETSIRDFYAATADGYSDAQKTEFSEQIYTLTNRTAPATEVINALRTISFPFEGKFIKIKSQSGKYIALNGRANGADWALVDATDASNSNDYIFYYSVSHELRQLYAQKTFTVPYKICDHNSSSTGVVNISASPVTANMYYLQTQAANGESARYAHDSGTYVNRCANMGDHESTHTWAIEEATAEELATLANSVNAPLLSGTPFTEGTEPGQVCIKEGNTFDADFAAQRQAVADNFTIEAYDALWYADASDMLKNKYTVAPIKTGRYYRFKASAGNIRHNNLSEGSERYLSNVNGGDNRLSFATSATAGTAFYFSVGSHLISAETGRYVVNNNNTANDSDPTNANNAGFIKMATANLPASSDPSAHKAQPFTIDAANAIELGAYKIRFGTGNLTRSIHLSATATGGSANCCQSAGTSDYAHNFYIEQVNTLPVEIHAIDNCGTAYFPVAVTVPEGYSVFTGEVNTKVAGEQETLVLTEQPSRIIPAYTPAFITGTPGTINVTIDYTAAAQAPESESPITGHFAAMGVNSDRGILMVKLTAPNENDEAVAALNATDGITVPTARFHKADNVGLLSHNTVVIEANEKALLLDDSVTPNKELNEIRVPLGNNKSAAIKSNVKVTTGISQIEIRKADGTNELFDLQGRRLSKPVKGINIINGRKVLVK